ncbi:MAG: hypothetical protein WAU75_06645 [Solirubrobacteraceae bacterium]
MTSTATILQVGCRVRRWREREHDPDLIVVAGSLFAETDDGARVDPDRHSIAIHLWRRGRAAVWKRYAGPPLSDDPSEKRRTLDDYRLQRRDVQDAINQLLGRDPEQARLRALGWKRLIDRLAREHIITTEQQLIATPFRFEFSDELLAELTPRIRHSARR